MTIDEATFYMNSIPELILGDDEEWSNEELEEIEKAEEEYIRNLVDGNYNVVFQN